MNDLMKKTLHAIKFGDMQNGNGLYLMPLLQGDWESPEYITMADAFREERIIIKEVNEQGSVPELQVENLGDVAILILDGEELMGAKQNRVLNTTVLLAPKSQSKIPVSCSESGRWHYTSESFRNSDLIMERKVREKKMASVSRSVRERGEYRSDQGEVWREIDQLNCDAGVEDSNTSAMKDAFLKNQQQLNELPKHFPCLENQCGFIAFCGHKFLGQEFVSRSAAYEQLHMRLIKSYLFDTIHKPTRVKVEGKAPSTEEIKALWDTFLDAEETSHPSVGLGTDHRYNKGEYQGTSLQHDECVVHGVFFQLDSKARETDYTMRSKIRRRRNLDT